jgi:glycopeptide antibiotics resistance protein
VTRKRIITVLFILYCLFAIWLTLLSRKPLPARGIEWRLMWSYREMIAGNPNWKRDVWQNIQNILFFMPFGLLFPLKKWKTIMLSSFAFSVLIEIAQYIFQLGLCEIDDVICNTLGALIGFWIWLALKKTVFLKKRN